MKNLDRWKVHTPSKRRLNLAAYIAVLVFYSFKFHKAVYSKSDIYNNKSEPRLYIIKQNNQYKFVKFLIQNIYTFMALIL